MYSTRPRVEPSYVNDGCQSDNQYTSRSVNDPEQDAFRKLEASVRDIPEDDYDLQTIYVPPVLSEYITVGLSYFDFSPHIVNNRIRITKDHATRLLNYVKPKIWGRE